jgi:hypothetical protein
MNFYVRLVLIVAAIVIGLWLLKEYGSQVSGPAGTPAVSASPSVPVVQTPSAPAVPAAPTPQVLAQPVTTPEDPAIDKVREMAQAARVELAGFSRDGGWLVITIRSTDRNALLNFLDVVQRYGLRNIDVKSGPQYREYMGPGGRIVYEATHRMQF